jgi:methionyl-tRNA formyltransferase
MCAANQAAITELGSRARVAFFTECNSPAGEEFLRRIHRHPHANLVALVTRPQGVLSPDYKSNAADVPGTAASLGIPVLRPPVIGNAAAMLEALGADHFVVANYQRLLPRQIYQLPHRFTIVFHVAPLPRYAGLVPWRWMRKNRETHGGVAAIRASDIMDAGDIIDELPLRLDPDWNEEVIREVHFKAVYKLLDRVLDRLPHLCEALFRPQELRHRTYYDRSGFVKSKSGDLGILLSTSATTDPWRKTVPEQEPTDV